MPTYSPAKKNTQLIFYTGLVQQASTLLLKSNPTLAAGDFKTSLDGGALGNLGTLPTVTPASSVMLKVTLATTETNGDNATFVAIDAAGAEWCDQLQNFQTAARQLDDLTFPATSGRSMVVDANGLVDANTVKVGPTGSGTAQTAGDIPARLPAALTANGNMKSSFVELITTALTEGAGGRLKAAFTTLFDVASPVLTAASVNQTGDSFARIGVAGVGLTNLGDARIANLDVTVSSRSTYAGGAVASVTAAVTITAASVQAVWDALTANLTTVGSVGKLIVTDLDAAISSRLATSGYTAPDNADIVAIKAKTDNLPAAPADETLVIAATNAIMSRLGAPVGADLSHDIAACATVAAIFAHVFGVNYGSKTFEQIVGYVISVLMGPTSGAGTTSEIFKTPANAVTDVTVANNATDRTSTTLA